MFRKKTKIMSLSLGILKLKIDNELNASESTDYHILHLRFVAHDC